MSSESIETPTPETPATVFSRSSTVAIPPWVDMPLFDESAQLCTDLEYHGRKPEASTRLQSTKSTQTLPDAPRIPLNSSLIAPYCLEDLDTPNLNKLGEKLFWVGPSMKYKPINDQLTIARKIQVTEDISLHCVWTEDTVFMKPLPSYICSYAFWEYLLDTSNDSINPEQRVQISKTALGFLRSYAGLIQHRSDFNIAHRHDLLGSLSNTTFEEFITFIKAFDTLPDSAVSIRWRFGELNLDALNFHSVIHLRKWHRHRFESRYGAYFQRFFPVVLFGFALFSVVLSAMQVILATQEWKDSDNKGLRRTAGVFVWFSTEAIGWCISFGAMFFVWWIGLSSSEAWTRHRLQKAYRKKMKAERAAEP